MLNHNKYNNPIIMLQYEAIFRAAEKIKFNSNAVLVMSDI